MNEEEKVTVGQMIGIYCRYKHGVKTKGELCKECAELREYAHLRLERCSFGNEKPDCNKCTIHCYRPDMRDRIRGVMRYVGPRLLIYDPLLLMRHLGRKMRKKRISE